MWAAAPGPAVLRRRVLGKFMPFQWIYQTGFGLNDDTNMSYIINHVRFVQERLLEMSGYLREFHLLIIVHQT
jgi:hypothetical protein